ncbi:MAG TPA: hypothetical protein VIJ93_06400, partial [bacterium]
GATVNVTFTIKNIGGSGAKAHYIVGFTDASNNPNGSNVSWYNGGVNCPTSSTFVTSTANNTVTITQALVVPAVGWSIQNIVILARSDADGTNVHCDLANCTVDNSMAFTVCAALTNTPTKTPTNTPSPTPGGNTPTKTPTSTNTAVGAPNTNTPTLVPTNTFTDTPTPTISSTPTITLTFTQTFTPTITNSPTPYPCNPPVLNGGAVMGTNVQGGVICFNNQSNLLTANSVFGMSLADVKNMADYQGTSLGVPVTLNIAGDWKLSFFSGDLTYDPALPKPYDRLHAFGVLVVDGNLTLNPGTDAILNSSFGGVVFVTGNLTIAGASEIDGAVIMGRGSIIQTTGKRYYNGGGNTPGNVILTGSAGNQGIIFYSPSLVTTAQQLVGQYREDISERKALLAIPNM